MERYPLALRNDMPLAALRVTLPLEDESTHSAVLEDKRVVSPLAVERNTLLADQFSQLGNCHRNLVHTLMTGDGLNRNLVRQSRQRGG
jgi:hypothetical protein